MSEHVGARDYYFFITKTFKLSKNLSNFTRRRRRRSNPNGRWRSDSEDSKQNPVKIRQTKFKNQPFLTINENGPQFKTQHIQRNKNQSFIQSSTDKCNAIKGSSDQRTTQRANNQLRT